MGFKSFYLSEKNVPDLEVGDEVHVGKFRNRPAVIKGFSKDENDQPEVEIAKINKKTGESGKGKKTKLFKFKVDKK